MGRRGESPLVAPDRFRRPSKAMALLTTNISWPTLRSESSYFAESLPFDSGVVRGSLAAFGTCRQDATGRNPNVS